MRSTQVVILTPSPAGCEDVAGGGDSSGRGCRPLFMVNRLERSTRRAKVFSIDVQVRERAHSVRARASAAR
jgi:hypothetical protein